MKRVKKIAHAVFGVLAIVCLLGAVAGLLYQVWAGYAADPGEAFESGYLGMAITWTGLIMSLVFAAAWTGTME